MAPAALPPRAGRDEQAPGAGLSGPTLRHALALGLLHGPAELLPISSSAHTELVPWLCGWSDCTDAPAQVRKAFEVALHTGTALALLLSARGELAAAIRRLDRARVTAVVLAEAIPGVVGLALARPIERRLGTPPTIAAALGLGAVALWRADRTAGVRGHESARARDGAWLGVAQACALVPGISRNGATLTAARHLGFRRADAQQLSRHVALPVIGGATALELARLAGASGRGRHGHLPAGVGTRLLTGAAAAFVSTLASARAIDPRVRERPLWPFAAYRIALAALVAKRLAA